MTMNKILAKIAELILLLNKDDTKLLITLAKAHQDKLVVMEKMKETI